MSSPGDLRLFEIEYFGSKGALQDAAAGIWRSKSAQRNTAGGISISPTPLKIAAVGIWRSKSAQRNAAAGISRSPTPLRNAAADILTSPIALRDRATEIQLCGGVGSSAAGRLESFGNNRSAVSLPRVRRASR